jgi:hypothetical protein
MNLQIGQRPRPRHDMHAPFLLNSNRDLDFVVFILPSDDFAE